MEDGRGESGELILIGTELLCLQRVWVSFGIQSGVAEHLTESGVVTWRVDGGVHVLLRWRGGGTGQWGSVRGATGEQSRAH